MSFRNQHLANPRVQREARAELQRRRRRRAWGRQRSHQRSRQTVRASAALPTRTGWPNRLCGFHEQEVAQRHSSASLWSAAGAVARATPFQRAGVSNAIGLHANCVPPRLQSLTGVIQAGAVRQRCGRADHARITSRGELQLAPRRLQSPAENGTSAARYLGDAHLESVSGLAPHPVWVWTRDPMPSWTGNVSPVGELGRQAGRDDHGVDDVDHTVRRQDVGGDDGGAAVEGQLSVLQRERDRLALEGVDLAVLLATPIA